MKSIEHLLPGEQRHYILCSCGEYIDMRNLSEVFKHVHADLPEPEWTHSVRSCEPVIYLKSGERLDLN